MFARETLLALLTLAEAVPAADNDLLPLARASFLEHLTRVSADPNVMMHSFRIDGKRMGSRTTRWNRDDGITYKSELTYHDRAFSTSEKTTGPDGQIRFENRYGFVSSHGRGDSATGASLLERTAFGAHRRLREDDERNGFKGDDADAGLRFRSLFRVATRQLFGEDENGNRTQRSAERSTLRDEARTEIELVGTKSFDTIRRSARDADRADDPMALANGVLLRYAAAEATQSLWSSTLANLVQRRVNRGLRPGDLTVTPQLDEDVPTVEAWTAGARRGIASIDDAPTRKRLLDDVTRQNDQAARLAALSWDVVNPRFERDPQSGEEVLKSGDVEGEDGQLRDMRAQLALLAKAGRDLSSVPSEWQYADQDGKARVALDFDEEGRPLADREMTVRAQLESYNAQLAAAAEGYAEVEKRMGGTQLDAKGILRYRIEPGTKSVLEINRPPASALEEAGLEAEATVRPERYAELVDAAAGGGKFRPLVGPGQLPIGPIPSASVGRLRPPQLLGYDEAAPKRGR